MKKIGIQCRSLNKRFGAINAVDSVSFDLEQGQTLSLLGPSGCGKTTLLRLIAGFEQPDSGTIAVRDRTVVDICARTGNRGGRIVPPDQRRIGFVFQDYALFPHLNVRDNIGFGVRGRVARRKRVDEMLELVGLPDQGASMPHELSGGQQQRVALARALAPDPDVVLLDEPFSNLDATRRRQVRKELDRILREAGTTSIFVTHDQEEAFNVGTRVAVMSEGRILKMGAPRDVYLSPASREVAEISGAVNLVAGESDGECVRCGLGELRLAQPCPAGNVQLLLRPESIRLEDIADERSGANGSAHLNLSLQASAAVSLRAGSGSIATSGAGPIRGQIQSIDFHGNHQHASVQLPCGERLRVRIGPSQHFETGQNVRVHVEEPVQGLPH